MRPCAVYYLIDPRNEKIRYVGISLDPKRRYLAHLKPVGSRYSACWVRSLIKAGLRPTLRIAVWLQNVEEAKRVEISLIASHSDLTNLSTGGEGGSGVWFSAERRAAHGLRVKERYKDPEARKRHSEAAKLGWENPEARARASLASTGRHMSEEAKVKIKNALLGHAVTDEMRSKLRAANIGRLASVEIRAKMRVAHTKIWAERKVTLAETTK